MKINSLTTKSGQTLKIGKISVLVGPNNSGKSRTLRDILERMQAGLVSKPVVLEDIQFEFPATFDEFTKTFDIEDSVLTIGQKVIKGIDSDLQQAAESQFDFASMEQVFNIGDHKYIIGTFTKFKVANLNSMTRLTLVKETKGFNPSITKPANMLQNLLKDAEVEKVLKEAFKLAFEMDIVLDYSGFVDLCFRVAKKMPDIPADPKQAYPVMSLVSKIDDQGDGFKSFVGIILSILLNKDRIVLLDEPEAFLHPSQARFLGKWIADNEHMFSGQLIVSTHNSNFLSGMLSSNNDMNIYRLNRGDDNTTYNLIPPAITQQLSKHPMLSSQRIVEAIFHKGVVVCEADADRATYQSVAAVEFSNQEVLFVHAHNKQTLKDVVSLLRAAKVPVTAISDIDILNDKHELGKLIQSFKDGVKDEEILDLQVTIANAVNSIPEDQILKELHKKIKELEEQLAKTEHTVDGAKGALNRINKEITRWSDAKSKGVAGFDPGIQGKVEEVIAKAKRYGLFIVPVGELEGWIDLGISKKNKWIIPALEEISKGNSPQNLKDFVKEIIDFLYKEPIEAELFRDAAPAAVAEK